MSSYHRLGQCWPVAAAAAAVPPQESVLPPFLFPLSRPRTRLSSARPPGAASHWSLDQRIRGSEMFFFHSHYKRFTFSNQRQ